MRMFISSPSWFTKGFCILPLNLYAPELFLRGQRQRLVDAVALRWSEVCCLCVSLAFSSIISYFLHLVCELRNREKCGGMGAIYRRWAWRAHPSEARSGGTFHFWICKLLFPMTWAYFCMDRGLFSIFEVTWTRRRIYPHFWQWRPQSNTLEEGPGFGARNVSL